MVSAILSRLVILVFGTLYPAYASYKAVRTKNVKEYVKWMMYWIVFALFCTVETFSDFLLSWFPFYYEFKIVFVLWLLSPITQGSSFLFRKFVHPQLARREKDIDELIDQTIKQGYSTFFDLGNKSIKVILKSVITGQSKLVDHLRHSYSTSDLSNDGHDIVPRPDAADGQEEEKEYELDNRLIEDQAELAIGSATSVTKSRSSSSALSLSIVKEEDGEDSEHVTTKTFTIPSGTRRHYTAKEGTAKRQQRCQSLPPFTDKYIKPKHIATTLVESKRQFRDKYQSVERKNITTSALAQEPIRQNSKGHALTRSLSHDSGSVRWLNTASSATTSPGPKAGRTGIRNNTEGPTIIKSDISKKSASKNVPQISLSQHASFKEEIEPEIKQAVRDIKLNSQDSKNALVASGEILPVASTSESVNTLETFSQHTTRIENTEDSTIPQVAEDSEDNKDDLKFNLLTVENLGDDLSNLLFLNVDNDSDDQCPTPRANDSPENLSQDEEKTSEKKDSVKEVDVKEKEDSTSKESDTSSDIEFGSLDRLDSGAWSEGSSSSLWETMSEASASDVSERYIENKQVASVIKEEYGPWSAPGSPTSFIRGSKYEEDEIESWNPPSLLTSQRNRSKDNSSWHRPELQKQKSFPIAASRSILHSWPSPSQLSGSSSTSQIKSSLSTKTHGYSFDPFQTWHPRSMPGATSYRSHSVTSMPTSLPRTLPSLSDTSRRPYTRPASIDVSGGESLYRKYRESAYRTNSASSKTYLGSGIGSLSTRSLTSSRTTHYPSKSYQSYMTKK